MARPWEADPSAEFKQRLGKSALELGDTTASPTCPDIWEMDNGDTGAQSGGWMTHNTDTIDALERTALELRKIAVPLPRFAW